MSKSQSEKILSQIERGDANAAEANKELHEVYKMTPWKQAEALRKKTATEQFKAIYKDRHFVIQSHGLMDIYKQLTHAEAGTFYKLFSYVQWNVDGLLIKEKQAMTQKEMSDIVGLSTKQLRRNMAKLIELGLIIQGGSDKYPTYTVNPEYVRMGPFRDKKTPFTRVHKTTSRHFFDKLDVKQLGFFIKLSLYIDFNTLIVVANPHEPNPDKITPLRISDIAELMNDSTNTVKTYIKALGNAGILREEGPAGSTIAKKTFYLHPEVVNRGKVGNTTFFDVLSHFTSLEKQMKYEKDRKQKEAMEAFIQLVRERQKASSQQLPQ
jgi:predicted transcriptional regulator